MQTLTNAELLGLRNTLQTLKENNACTHIRLAYAVDKTLREIGKKLETYDEHEEKLVEKHTREDEEGRNRYITNSGEVVVCDEDMFVTLDGEEYGTPQKIEQEGAWHDLDIEAYEDDISELQDEEVSVDIHQVDEEVLFENLDLDGSHAEIDLGTIDPMLK